MDTFDESKSSTVTDDFAVRRCCEHELLRGTNTLDDG